jgi:multidrug efflux pump subunit AcrB
VPISAIANVRYTNSISVINRKNQKRVITLASDLSGGHAANEIIPQIELIIANMDIPEGYSIKMTGQEEEMQETMSFLILAFGGAFALMFLILVTQFNSIIKPMIIATTVIFSLIGVAIGFTITHKTLSVIMNGVGIFALAGIVIRNGILLLEFIDELRGRGLEVSEAVVEGGATRMTPVILTASAAILGLIPLAIGLNMDFETLFTQFNPHFYLGGDNVVFWGPLAWTMIFGLLMATFLTLLVVPAMYMLGYKVRARLEKYAPWVRYL